MNDDRLTADLHDAFRAATADLTYDRAAPRLRRTPAYAVPVAVTGLVAAGVATAVLLPSLASSPARDTAAPEAPTSEPSSATASGPPMTDVTPAVLDFVSFAGSTYTFTRETSAQGRLVARDVGTLPDGAQEVETTTDATAWFGEEPSTGDPALFVQAPTRYDGSIFSLSGAGWTQEQLVDVLEGGEPQVVPHVD